MANSEINLGFWKNYRKGPLGRPAFVLAPMADVTDCAFRKVIAKYGKPDVTWTEFVSADGLMRATPEGKAKLMRDLIYIGSMPDKTGMSSTVTERPIVAQLFSSHPEYMKQAAKLCAELGFDGIDINMGCPDKSIEKQCAGAAMMKNPKLAQKIIRAAQEGVKEAYEESLNKDHRVKSIIPVSVKTRIGYNKNELETWLPALLAARPALVTIHARTRKEMSKVSARWEHVKRAVEIRDEFFNNVYINSDKNNKDKTLIFGNGDAVSILDGYAKAKEAGADGVMLGRAIFGNPWLFKGIADCPAKDFESNFKPYEPSVKEKLEVMVEHTKEFAEKLGDIKNFAIMKKHYKAYVNGFDGAKELRLELMEKAGSAGEVEAIVDSFLRLL